MASVVVELNSQGDSSLPTRSTEVLDVMDSVPLDDSFGDNTTHEPVGRCKVCNHPFTIRGFVLNMRQREPRLCYPFRLKGSSDLWKELPPMVVPKSKYWRCPVCVPEDEWDVLKDLYGMSNKLAPKRAAATDVAISLVGQSSKVTNTAVGVRITEVSGSTDAKDNTICSCTTNVCADVKGKGKAHVDDDLPPFTGFHNGFLKKSSSQGIQQQTADYIKASSSEGKDCQNEKGGEVSRALSKDNFVEAPIRVTTYMPGIVSPHCCQTQQVNLPDLNECSGEPLYEENNENVFTDNNISNLCEDDDDYLGAERRKKPKVRLLSELLGLKETQVPAKARNRNPSSTGSLDENIKWKRVGSQDEDSKCMEIKSSNVGTNKVVGTIEISESESENGSEADNASTERISDALAKKRKSKDMLLEKRNKIRIDHGESSSMSHQKVKPKSVHDNEKSFDLLRKHYVPAQTSERNWVLTKKRGKVLQARKETPSLVPCNSRMPQQFGSTQKDKEAEQNAIENVQCAFGNAHQVPSGYLNKENDQPCIPMRKVGFCASSSQAEPMLVDGNSVRNHKENRNVGGTNIAFKSIAVGISFTENQSDENGERSNDIKTNPKEKKAGIPEAEGRSPLPQQIPLQVPNSVVNHNALTNEVRGRIQDIDINSVPTDDKTNEQGRGDDIPMDIVELMAKNQYERHLDYPKDKQTFLALPAPTGTIRRQDGICGSYGQRMENFAQPHFLSVQKPVSLDNRNSVFNGSWGHLSDLNSSPLGARGLPGENPVSTRFFTPSQSEEHVSPYSSRALAPNKWNGNIDMAAQQRLPPSFLQAMDSYTKLRAFAPGQNATEASRVWASSVMASHMPSRITNSQLISQSSNVLNREKIHHHSPGNMFNFSSAGTRTGKQHTLSFSNAYNSGHLDSSAGSVDVNDDRIPALQLLGLGHSKGNSQNTDLSLGPQKTTTLNSSRQPFIKSMGRPSAVQDNYRPPCYPTPFPSSQPFSPSYQNNEASISRAGAGFMGAIPLTSHGQRNMVGSHFAPPGGESQSLRQRMAPPLDKGKGVVSMASPLDKGKGIAPLAPPLDKGKGIASMALSLDKGKGIASMSSSINKGKGIASMPTLSFANAFLMKRDSRKVQPKAGVRWDKKFFPASDKQICQLNRNPSEFTDLKLAQSFMYGASELRPRASARDRCPKRVPRSQSPVGASQDFLVQGAESSRKRDHDLILRDRNTF